MSSNTTFLLAKPLFTKRTLPACKQNGTPLHISFHCFCICLLLSPLYSCLNELRKLLTFFNCNNNYVPNRKQNSPRNPTTIVPRKDIILVLSYLEVQSKIITKQLDSCMNKFLRAAMILGLFSKAFFTSRLFSPTKIESTVAKSQKSCIRLVVGTISTLEKQNVDRTTEKLNTLKRLQVAVMHLLSQTMSCQMVTT